MGPRTNSHGLIKVARRSSRLVFAFALPGVLLSLLNVAWGAAADDAAATHFERQVRPLLLAKCSECHGEETQEGELRLDTAAGLMRGGKSGPVVVAGEPEKSRLIELVRGTEELQMPPDEKLDRSEVEALAQWIRDGAVWPAGDSQATPVASRKKKVPGSVPFGEEQKRFWAFQPLLDPPLPIVANEKWPTSPVDFFVLARLEAEGLTPAPQADKLTLLRRVTFDLTGLPPTPQEVQSFLGDESPQAFATVVDRLLASPRYGERWGRHWLDVARFAESTAHDGNGAYPHAWRYRDYVIQSFNSDKPYDQFIIEQLAGDLLPPTNDKKLDYDRIVATGFLQVGPKPVVMRDKRQMLLDIADEQLHTTSIAFLGLTVACARCHDHKFDAIPTQDYYSLAGVFMSTQVMQDLEPDSKWLEPQIDSPDGTHVKVMAVKDQSQPADVSIHLRGNYRTLGEAAPRRYLQVIAGEGHPPMATQGSGRLELARWISSADHPLTARVAVNRIWQRYFGAGLVASSDNFGEVGEKPSHPELLDWLARRFIETGWSFKVMHRLLILSSTYRQACVENAQATKIDSGNRLLWRMSRKRLEAEEVRDSLLAVSGQLDLTMGGTLFNVGDGCAVVSAEREFYSVELSIHDYQPFRQPRRSIYLPMPRNVLPEILQLFDCANEHSPIARRNETTVATQALFLLNSPFVRDLARALARKLVDSAGVSDEARISDAYVTLFGRHPSDEERQSGLGYLATYADQVKLNHPEPAVNGPLYRQLVLKEPGLVAYYDDQRVDVPDVKSLNELKEITVEYWIKPAEVRLATVVAREGSAGRYWRSGTIPMNVGGAQKNVVFHEFFGTEQGGFRAEPTTLPVAEVGEWTHVVMTFGNGRRQLYVNGRLIDQLRSKGDPLTGPVDLSIGAREDTEGFQGEIDDVAIYRSVLSSDTISTHFHQHPNSAPEDPIRAARIETWTSFCQGLMCMNEFMFLD